MCVSFEKERSGEPLSADSPTASRTPAGPAVSRVAGAQCLSPCLLPPGRRINSKLESECSQDLNSGSMLCDAGGLSSVLTASDQPRCIIFCRRGWRRQWRTGVRPLACGKGAAEVLPYGGDTRSGVWRLAAGRAFLEHLLGFCKISDVVWMTKNSPSSSSVCLLI